MPKNRSALRAGLLMIGSVALVIAIVIGIKGLAWFREHTVTHLVAFDLKTNIGGLRVGDEVRVGGFKVGEVKRITLVKDNDQTRDPYFILVAFSIPERYSIRDDAKIRVDGTLTGAPASTTELLAKVGGLAPEIQGMLADIRTKTLPALNGTLTDVQTKSVPLVNQTLENFKTTSENAAALTTDIRKSYDPVLL